MGNTASRSYVTVRQINPLRRNAARFEGPDLPVARSPVSRTPRSTHLVRRHWPVFNALVAASLVSALAHADIYKFVDRDGHYADYLPPATPAGRATEVLREVIEATRPAATS